MEDVFDGSDQLPPPTSPVSLIAPLTDQQVTATGAEYDIFYLFGHTDDMPLWFTASLISGNLLPYYVRFDSETGIFQFDIAAAAEAGANSLQIRVIAVDPDGNQASGVFRVNFQNTDKSIDESTDESIDAAPAPAPASESPEQKLNPDPISPENHPGKSLVLYAETEQDALLLRGLQSLPMFSESSSGFRDLVRGIASESNGGGEGGSEGSADGKNAETDFGKESLNEQVLRAGELGYQQEKLKFSLLLEALYGRS